MPLRKSHLYSSLWQSCDQLRGGMDASQYKDYVLTLLFMKYVSDKYAGTDDFADITVPPGGSFADMVALKGTKEIGDGINKVIGKLANANDYLLKGVIDQADFNDESKLGKGKESGESKGQFYTPAEVSRIMARVIGIGPDTRRDHTVYDPTCGSGSLLIKAADHALSPCGPCSSAPSSTYRRSSPARRWSARVPAEIQGDNTLAAPPPPSRHNGHRFHLTGPKVQ